MTVAAARDLCGGRLLATHEGGYSAAYVPYCGLRALEAMSGHATGVADPWAASIENYGAQKLQPHQEALIDSLAALHLG